MGLSVDYKPRYVKFFRGTPTAYEMLKASPHKPDPDTLYFICEKDQLSGKLYLGEKLIDGTGEGGSGSIIDIDFTGLSDGDILVYDANSQKWTCKGVAELVPEGRTVQIFENTLDQGEMPDDGLSEFPGEPAEGDFAIIKELITDGKYSRTGYIYHEDQWVALSEAVSASNVYLENDLITTDHLTVPAGTSLEEALHKLLNGANVTVQATQPSVEITGFDAKLVEVGTEVTPSWIATFKPGNYTFGPETGITATSYNVTNSEDGQSSSESRGQFDKFTVNDDTDYSITVEVEYGEGAVPVDEYGHDYPEAKIEAGTVSATTKSIKGYRAAFVGTTEDKTAEVDNTLIRSLTKSSGAISEDGKLSLIIPLGAKRMIVAYPATIRDISHVLDRNAGHIDIVGCFTKSQVEVNGNNGFDAIPYKVFVMDRANANVKENVYIIQI